MRRHLDRHESWSGDDIVSAVSGLELPKLRVSLLRDIRRNPLLDTSEASEQVIRAYAVSIENKTREGPTVWVLDELVTLADHMRAQRAP